MGCVYSGVWKEFLWQLGVIAKIYFDVWVSVSRVGLVKNLKYGEHYEIKNSDLVISHKFNIVIVKRVGIKNEYMLGIIIGVA